MPQQLKPNNQRAQHLLWAIWLVLLIQLSSLFSNYLQYDLLQALQQGIKFTDAELQANDQREALLGKLGFLANLLLLFFLIRWFWRAYANLHQKIKPLAHYPLWAFGAWFVPFVNLYRPYQIMKELYVETAQLLRTEGRKHPSKGDIHLLGWWWAFHLISVVASQVALRIAPMADTIELLVTSTLASVITLLLSILYLTLTRQVVKTYTEAETQLLQLEAQATQTPAETPLEEK